MSGMLDGVIPEAAKAVTVMRELGHVATRAQLRARLTRAEFDEALARGYFVRIGHGAYALASAREAQQAALRLRGTASHLSAAQLHGWPIAREPRVPWVTVPRNRNVPEDVRRQVNVVHGVTDGAVTSELRTVLDCARKLPFNEALTVADSALRSGDVDGVELRGAAAAMRGPGCVQCRLVAAEATPLAASVFESELRAIGVEVGLDLQPQFEIELPERVVHPDLVDPERRLVVEAESYRHHYQDIQVFQQDLWRYTSLVIAGFVVLRFGYHHVRQQPEWVAACLRTYL